MSHPTNPTITTVSTKAIVTLAWAMPAAVAVDFVEQTSPILTNLLRNHQTDGSTLESFDLATWDSSEFQPPFHSNHRGDEDAWALPAISEREADLKAVCWAVDNWTDTGRGLAAVVINHPEGLHTRDIAEKAHYTGSIPSAFRHIAGRLRAINRAPFWHSDPDSRGHERGQLVGADTDAAAFKVVKAVFEARYPNYLD